MEVLKKVQRNYRRALACLLTIAMTLTNVGTNLSVAFAAKEQAQALFLLDGGELQAAIQDALASEDPFDYASLQLTAGSASLKNSYKKLLGGNGASVYRLDAEIDDSYAPGGTALQMFYNADAESVIFLFINESDTSVVFRANVDGYETARITVSANSANVENEEDLDDSYDESAVYGDGSAAGNTAEDGKIPGEGPGVSTENSTDNGEASDDTEISIEVPVEEADETTEEESVSTSEDSVGEAPPEDMGSDVTDSENDVSVSVDDSPGDSADAAGEADAADQIDEAGTADEEDAVGELDGADEPDDADAIGETLAFSKHEAALVATSVEVIPDEESSDEDEIIISLDEEADMATPSNGQSNEGADADPEDKDIPEVTVEPDDPATATGSNADDGSDIIKVDDEQFLEDDSIAWNGELNGRAYNTVTIWDSANARAFVVDAEELGGSGVFENDQFEGTAQVGDAIITVKAVDADIPETAQVVAEEVVSDQIEASVASKLEEQERTLTEYRAWDIRLVDETGSDLDFDGTVEVTIDGVTLDGDQMDVFHVEEPAAEGVSLFRKAASAPLQAEEIPSDAQDGTVVFETTHFSVYVLIGSIEDAEGYWHVEFKDGETPIANQMIPDGELAMEPAAPDHEGYIFVGWLGSNGETLTDPITQDTVFTAQYQKIETCTITVEFEYADGTMAAPAFTAVVQKKESYTAAVPVPEKQGYEIEIPAADGITYDEGKRVLELSFDSVEEDKDIVVTYQGGTVTYTVKHMLQDLQDEDSYTEYTSETKTAELGTMSAAEAKLIPGFTSVPPTNVNISSDTVIQVLYNRNYYTVSYNTDGGSYIPPVRYKYGARVEMPEAPTKIGYDFAGWDKE
ncbi:MAG TPA: InlB B-repeat-containing protein, partial [Candidatus Ventrimonas merdavium]|nr:InlB B-repeat-containing protein [Candidatus Ventrimonas merdavium]